MDQASTQDTQAFLSGVADQIDAQADRLESANGVASGPTACEARRHSSVQFLRKTVYTASYTLSYGVCFPIFLACRYIPKQNQFVNGLIDGSESANRSADEMIDRVNDWRASQKQRVGSPISDVAEAMSPA